MRTTGSGAGLSAVLVVLLVGVLSAAEPFRSGPQPKEMLPGVFEPLNINGPNAGEAHCLVCENGLNPVVMIFAREVSDPLVRLLSRVEAATAKHQNQNLGSFVVFLGDADALRPKLEKLAKEKGFKHLILSVEKPEGPEGFNVARDADVTVVLYSRHVVQANHPFKKGQLTDRNADAILADLPKIVPSR